MKPQESLNLYCGSLDWTFKILEYVNDKSPQKLLIDTVVNFQSPKTKPINIKNGKCILEDASSQLINKGNPTKLVYHCSRGIACTINNTNITVLASCDHSPSHSNFNSTVGFVMFDAPKTPKYSAVLTCDMNTKTGANFIFEDNKKKKTRK